jgi:hypothetical protein
VAALDERVVRGVALEVGSRDEQGEGARENDIFDGHRLVVGDAQATDGDQLGARVDLGAGGLGGARLADLACDEA